MIPYDEEFVETKEAFDVLKSSGRLAFGQVPLLEIDGLKIVQTQAILRHLARKKGIQGSTAEEEAVADMAVNAILDARMSLVTVSFQDDPVQALAKFRDTVFPKLMSHLDRLMENERPFVAGQSITYADVSLFEFLVYASDALGVSMEVPLENYPAVRRQAQAMAAFGHMQEYLVSSSRQPLPNSTFVKQVCEILGMPRPAYL
jgi:glutathione S-transferase